VSRFLSSIGIVLSIAYIAVLWWFFDGRFDEIKKMAPNNIGDFLAGVFGPLSILWLILGFFQQGIELRQNTRALELQAEELRNSVEQQKDLVEVSRDQIKAEHEKIRIEREQRAEEARPKFIFSEPHAMYSHGDYLFHSKIKNVGNNAKNLVLTFSPLGVKYQSMDKLSFCPKDHIFELNWRYANPIPETILSITYIDDAGNEGAQTFKCSSTYLDIGSADMEITVC